jgi:hypothetical protein
MAHSIRIESWSVVIGGTVPDAPEARTSHLCGHVYGHPRFPDGTAVRTSPIIGYDEDFGIRTWSIP